MTPNYVSFYSEFRRQWQPADAPRPELREAQDYLKQSGSGHRATEDDMQAKALAFMLALAMPVPFDPALAQDRGARGQAVDDPVKRVEILAQTLPELGYRKVDVITVE